MTSHNPAINQDALRAAEERAAIHVEYARDARLAAEDIVSAAIASLPQAGEPVVWRWRSCRPNMPWEYVKVEPTWLALDGDAFEIEELYTHPAPSPAAAPDAGKGGGEVVVPEGWQLVPKVMTREQLEAVFFGPVGAEDDMSAVDEKWLIDMYQAYLAAAPSPPTPDAREAVEEQLRGAATVMSEIESRFPNWRSYRDLIDCIDCTLAARGADTSNLLILHEYVATAVAAEREACAVLLDKKAEHWRKEAQRHHRSGRRSDCENRDLERAALCDQNAAAIRARPAP